jgi:hypothetical protein
MEIKCVTKNDKFHCNICDFNCSKKSNYELHINTKKHIRNVEGNLMETLEMSKNANCDCNCGKQFKSESGLWKHKKKCCYKLEEEKEDPIKSDETINQIIKDEIIIQLLKQNAKLIEMIENKNK